MLKEFQQKVKNELLNLTIDFEVSKIKDEDRCGMKYTDDLKIILHCDGQDVEVNITVAPTFVCVHNDLLKGFLSDEDVLTLNKNLPQMYELQKRRCEAAIAKHEAEIAKHEAEIARLKMLECESEQTTESEGEQE